MRKLFLNVVVVLVSSITITAKLHADEKAPNTSTTKKVSDVTEQEDPHLWLEDVTGEKALQWVKERNSKTQSIFDTNADFIKLRDDILDILNSKERIPAVAKYGDYFYNFWRDEKNERGIWRRTTLEEYKKPTPNWEIVLDLDAIAAKEKENWVWNGAQLLRPGYKLALISLSRGGADATVTREFDMEKKQFVEGGFYRPEAKGSMGWIDENSVFINTDFGPGSMTTSGYPRLAKRWKRGTPIEKADLIYEGLDKDMSISALHDDSPGFERDFVSRNLAFYNDELYWLNPEGKLIKIDAPNTANKSVVKQYLLLELRDAWEVGGKSYPAGALLVSKFDDFIAGKRNFDIAFEPTANTSLASYGATKDHLFINVLEDVKNRIYVLTPSGSGWNREPLVGAPQFGSISISAVDPDESNDYFLTVNDYITPTTLMIGTIGKAPEKLKQLPAFFDASNLQITQHFATSDDGTKVPYFMVAPKDIKLDGKNPTLLYGYGGFEISLTPNYSGSVGRAWTSQGGVYVVANIRGGGEYGPRWHQAALKANRLRAYEDFAAVAKDLVRRGVTTAKQLGIQGGSNGGLLVGNMFTQYPDLFSAAVCQVPLLDMKRYHLLLAGASWMAEYGNPDQEGEWDYIQTYSPYQNVREKTKYPAILFTTSTRDDRVHPGHARKMMARMEEQGHTVFYYENIEGGHGGSANNKQAAYMQALAYTFLKQRLFEAK
jgi:prolyl oligopeptidase